MTASYSALLLEVRNPNLSAYSMSIPSEEVRIRPAPLPCSFEAPSIGSFQIERSVVVWESLAGSADVNSMTKSAKTCHFIAFFWPVSDVKLAQLYGPLQQSFGGLWFMQYLLHRVFCWNFYGMSLEIWAELSSCGYQSQN